MEQQILGETHYHAHLYRIAAGRVNPASPVRGPAWLVPEPENPYDSKAVKVVIAEGTVGYLPREKAELWQPVLQEISRRSGRYVACPALIYGDGTRVLEVAIYLPVKLCPHERDAYEAEARRAAKREALQKRFDPMTAARIMIGDPWEGATREMVVEACGYPDDEEKRVMKSKTRHVLKYRAESGSKIRLRIVLEDGVVVGWEQKG